MRFSFHCAVGVPLLSLVLVGCAGDAPPRASAPPSRAAAPKGIERVMGKDSRALLALFGDPNLDVHEGPARKLQFANGVCVLDAYLYPTAAGREPVVSYIDARNLNGDDVDKPSCIAALSLQTAAH